MFMPDYPLQIENNTHPVFYEGRPGQGTAYTRIDSVVLIENKIIFNVAVFNCPPDASHYEIIIDDPTCMKLLPSLLNCEISCMDALQQLMPYFMEKYPTQVRQTPFLEGIQKSRMLQLE